VLKVNRRWKILGLLASFAIVALLSAQTVYGHESSDGNARVEIVHEPTYPPALQQVESKLFDADPTLNLPGWSWAAISMTDPQLGDCHNGSVDPTYLRALRLGWFKNGNMLAPETMIAWITYYDQIKVEFNGDYPASANIEIELNTANPSQHYWDFRQNGSVVETVYDGPNQYLKCFTFGGWASDFNQAIGNAEFRNVKYTLFGGATTDISGNPAHVVKNSPYNYSVSGMLSGTYNFFGNN